jgi:transposase
MMGRQPNQQQKMFYNRINLDQRIRSDHVLRQIAQHLDFDFIYNEVQETYGANGNVSVPPPVILKTMLRRTLTGKRSLSAGL